MIRRLLLPLALAFALVAAPAVAGAAEIAGYDGTNPFRCKLQRVGTGTDFPRPDADPFCVEYDKTHQTITDLGIVDFLAQEPARVAAATDKCFYYQRDHWRSAVDGGWEQSELYNWDGGYFIDKARGVGGVYAENLTLNNVSVDPTLLPFFPAAWEPYFGWGRGGLQITDSIPIDPACAARARSENPYRD
jgi:hypothetical protein